MTTIYCGNEKNCIRYSSQKDKDDEKCSGEIAHYDEVGFKAITCGRASLLNCSVTIGLSFQLEQRNILSKQQDMANGLIEQLKILEGGLN